VPLIDETINLNVAIRGRTAARRPSAAGEAVPVVADHAVVLGQDVGDERLELRSKRRL
jgi:hypothetical protein